MKGFSQSKLVISIFLITLLFCGCKSPQTRNASKPHEKPVDVQIVAHPTMSGKLDKNIAWCCTFQLAWNVLCDWAGADIRFTKQTPLTRLMEDARRMQTDSINLDPESYVACCGFFGQGIVKKTLREVRKKFGSKANTQFLRQLQRDSRNYEPNQILAYSHLLKILKFPEKFELFDWPLYFFVSKKQETAVQCFGINEFNHENKNHSELSKQVDIFDYKNKDNFIVCVKTLSDDIVILGKISAEKNLHQAIEKIHRRINNSKPDKLEENATLKIPAIEFFVRKGFSELYCNPFISDSKRVTGHFFTSICQTIELKMDESGVKVESICDDIIDWGSEPIQPRHIVFNKPLYSCCRKRRLDIRILQPGLITQM